MSNEGGKRAPGRPPLPPGVARILCAYRMHPEVKRYLDQTGNATQAIEQALRRSKAFRDWKESRK